MPTYEATTLLQVSMEVERGPFDKYYPPFRVFCRLARLFGAGYIMEVLI